MIPTGTTLPSTLLYGIGEDSAPLLRDMDNKRHTLWTQGAYYEQGQGINLYGAHPFNLNIESGNLYGAHPFYLNIESGNLYGAHPFYLNIESGNS